MNLDEITAAPTRDLSEWLPWEDARLLDCSLGMQYFSVQDLAIELGRDPLLVLRRILDSEVPEMVGFEATQGSEEEAEFLALGLAGAPLELILRWCTGSEEQEDRPEWDELAMYLSADLRPALLLAREAGLWFTRSDQLEALLRLVDRPAADVVEGASKVLERLDVPTPPAVLAQILGTGVAEAPVDWRQICAPPVAPRERGSVIRRYGKRRRRASAGGTRRKYRPWRAGRTASRAR